MASRTPILPAEVVGSWSCDASYAPDLSKDAQIEFKTDMSGRVSSRGEIIPLLWRLDAQSRLHLVVAGNRFGPYGLKIERREFPDGEFIAMESSGPLGPLDHTRFVKLDSIDTGEVKPTVTIPSIHICGEPDSILATLFRLDEHGRFTLGTSWTSGSNDCVFQGDWTIFADYVMEGQVRYFLRAARTANGIRLDINLLGMNRDRFLVYQLEANLDAAGVTHDLRP